MRPAATWSRIASACCRTDATSPRSNAQRMAARSCSVNSGRMSRAKLGDGVGGGGWVDGQRRDACFRPPASGIRRLQRRRATPPAARRTPASTSGAPAVRPSHTSASSRSRSPRMLQAAGLCGVTGVALVSMKLGPAVMPGACGPTGSLVSNSPSGRMIWSIISSRGLPEHARARRRSPRCAGRSGTATAASPRSRR